MVQLCSLSERGKLFGARISQELRESCKTSDVAIIKMKRLVWLGHVIRMEQTRGKGKVKLSPCLIN